MTDHEKAAQDAGEAAYDKLLQDEGGCGCDTCVVREILEAAWPHLLELARQEVRTPVVGHPEHQRTDQVRDVPAIDLSQVDPALVTPHRLAGP